MCEQAVSPVVAPVTRVFTPEKLARMEVMNRTVRYLRDMGVKVVGADVDAEDVPLLRVEHVDPVTLKMFEAASSVYYWGQRAFVAVKGCTICWCLKPRSGGAQA